MNFRLDHIGFVIERQPAMFAFVQRLCNSLFRITTIKGLKFER